jgi:hypothetical protein
MVTTTDQRNSPWITAYRTLPGSASWQTYEWVEQQYELDHLYGNDLMRW